MEMRAVTLPSPCHCASSYLSPLPSLSPTQFPSHHATSLAKPLSSSSSHRRANPITSRRSSLLTCLSDMNTQAELESNFDIKKKAADVVDELKGTSIFLVGMKSAMKTHIGKVLADELRYYFFDSDSLVEDAFGGEAAAKLAFQSDPQGFRESETEVLKQLSAMGRLVVCAGDSAVQSSTNLALLRDGISVWVDLPLDVLAKEAPQTIANPDSFPEVLAALSMRYNDLREGYGTADATISLQRVATQQGYDDLDSVTTKDMAVETLKQMEKLVKVRKMMEAAAKPF
ncbi:Shikimate kinase family protein [Rhynchospora pubera]|uniref:Shikimate kinase family protein n=1 Tax=Rhynchospora pubera TaxID=906938 RepID=A0AAV8G5V0_9POAL|nr:Shikimate kinase family protein [Rhynchospora pubera]